MLRDELLQERYLRHLDRLLGLARQRRSAIDRTRRSSPWRIFTSNFSIARAF
jgi:hypothetical protein